jgi:hypothetical protein
MKTSARTIAASLSALGFLAIIGSSTTQATVASSSHAARWFEAYGGPLAPRPALGRSDAKPLWMRWGDPSPDLSRGYAFVSQFYGTAINGYRANNKRDGAPVCRVPAVQDVNGIAVDETGKLYVPQEVPSQSGGEYGIITVYGPRCGRLMKTLSSTYPLLNAAIDGSTVYGMDNVGASPTRVSVYAGGATSPTSYLTGPINGSGHSTINGYAITVDGQHDVFVSVYAPDSDWNSEVIEYPGGQMPAIELTGTLWIGADFPGGVLVDKNENLLVVNPNNNSSLAVYAPPYTSAPIRTIPFNGGASYCALNRPETRLYCTDYEYGSVDVYKYPSGLYLYSFSNGLVQNNVPEGIALQPAAPL